MGRKSENPSLLPWEMPETPWKNEAQFWTWVKGTIRKGWSRHPVRIEYKKANRMKMPRGKITKRNPSGMVWCCQCEICNRVVRETETEVDHINKMEEEKWYDNIEAFIRRMYVVTFDDLQILCKECHGIKTYSDRMNISFDEARIEKEIIAVCKTTATQKKFLTDRGIIPESNSEKRKEQIRGVICVKL